MAVHHVVLKRVVVVALVEKGIDAPSVNLQLSMLQYVAWYGYGKGRRNLLAVSREKQLVEGVVVYVSPQHPVKQVGLEVYDYVVAVVYEVGVVVKVKNHLRMPDNLVFPPLGKFLRKGYGEVRLVHPHGERGVWLDAICVQHYAIRVPFEERNHPHWVFPFLDIALPIGVDGEIV